MERPAADPLWHDHELRRARQTPRGQARDARRRSRERQEPDSDHRPVSSGGGIKGRADGLRWGIGYEALAVGARGGANAARGLGPAAGPGIPPARAGFSSEPQPTRTTRRERPPETRPPF